jgi:hypothetical protein
MRALTWSYTLVPSIPGTQKNAYDILCKQINIVLFVDPQILSSCKYLFLINMLENCYLLETI